MAHFAELDKNNKVLRVISVNNSDIIDSNGNESEDIGKQFCNTLLGGNWIQTSYNGTFRKNFAGTGMTYDSDKDVFLYPQPFDSWILDEDSGMWNAPVEKPMDGKKYIWNDSINNWEKYN
jgi:hypothetical protein